MSSNQSLLEGVANSPHALTDGQLTFPYQEVPPFFERLDQFFSASGINLADRLAFECFNSVPSALTLLYLLQKGYSFVLLPPSGKSEKGLSLKPIPTFCSYRVVVERSLSKQLVQGEIAPEQFLLLEKNEPYSPSACNHGAAKLYLRTSGSMGASKIVVHSQSKLLGNALNCVKKYQFESHDRVAIPVPLAHMYGLGAVFLPAILVGASIDLLDKANVLKYLARERKFKPTITFVTPALCDMLRRGFRRARSYKVVVTSGQRIQEELFRAFSPRVGGTLVNQYGSSEMGAIAACNPTDSLAQRVSTIGTSMEDVELRVELADDGSIVGELYCKHQYGFDGYVDEDGNWIAKHTPESWYRTGDMAKKLPNGYIEVVGRADNSINRSGYLVLFSDIESMMEKIEGIKQVIVVEAQGKSKRGQRIAAFCLTERKATLTGAEIRKASFDHLPTYAIPDDVFVVKTWPLLPSGKVDRQALVAISAKVDILR